jgi:glycosyltransferase involved in cell wall biosynthesis
VRLRYVQNARLPTEKAHGYQIAKMCEAIGRDGADVELWHARRYQHDPRLAHITVHDYYGVEPVFRVAALPNLDVLRFASTPGLGWTQRLVPLQQVAWAWAAARRAAGAPAALWYTRDLPVALTLTARALPTVLEVHAIPRAAGRGYLRRLATRPSLRRVVAITSCIAEDLEAFGFARARTVVLPDAADPALFAGALTRAAARQALGLPGDRPIVGYVGRFTTLEMEKGLPELVAALGALTPMRGREPLLVAVGGPLDVVPRYEAHARATGTSSSRLRFVDRVPNREVPAWIAAFDVAVLPAPNHVHHARYASPLKLFEYMAAGAAIVASDLPAIRDVLRDGENALRVAPGAPAALAAGLSRALGDPALAARLGACARRDAGRYTWTRRARAALAGLGFETRVTADISSERPG